MEHLVLRWIGIAVMIAAMVYAYRVGRRHGAMVDKNAAFMSGLLGCAAPLLVSFGTAWLVGAVTGDPSLGAKVAFPVILLGAAWYVGLLAKMPISTD